MRWMDHHSMDPRTLELVDAKEATTSTDLVALSSSIRGIMHAINELVKYEPPSHIRTVAVHLHFSSKKEHVFTNRADQILMTRILSGHSPLFQTRDLGYWKPTLHPLQ